MVMPKSITLSRARLAALSQDGLQVLDLAHVLGGAKGPCPAPRTQLPAEASWQLRHAIEDLRTHPPIQVLLLPTILPSGKR